MNKFIVQLDPRTKFILLGLANVVAFTQRSTVIEVTWVVLLIVLITLSGLLQSAVTFSIAFVSLLVLQHYGFGMLPEYISRTFYILVVYARKIFPCLIIGSLIIKKTTLRQMMQGLREWRIPESFIIALSVTIRYFPAIKEEITHIKNSIKLRDIHGLKKAECYLVPIIVSASITADELTASAVTRGIENPCKKTSILALKITFQDVICIFTAIIFCIASILNLW